MPMGVMPSCRHDGLDRPALGKNGEMGRMKTVVCYGDSNTYGYDPVTGRRYPRDVRWTGRLQALLGDGYHVVEEGCNGRTTIYKEPGSPWKSGLEYLKPCLNSHKPIDILVIMLGTNDLKRCFGLSAVEVAAGAERLVEEVEEFVREKLKVAPTVLLVSPPEIGEKIASSAFGASFDETAIARSRELAALYEDVARRHGCEFFDAALAVRPSDEDSVHLMPEGHEKLASALADAITGMGK